MRHTRWHLFGGDMWRQGHYRAAVETAVDAIIVFDAAGTIHSVNPATSRMFGHEPQDLVGRHVSMLIPASPATGAGDDPEAHWRADRADASGRRRSVLARRRDGSPIPIELSIAAWEADDGCRFSTGIMRDLGPFRAAEAALEESQAWLQTVTDAAQAGLVVIGRDHRIRFGNRAYAMLLNLAPTDLAGLHLREIVPDLYAIVSPRIDGAFAGERKTYQTVFPDPVEPTLLRSLSSTYQRSRNAAGEEVVVLVVTDVTELKRSEMAHRASRDMLQSVVDGTQEAIFAKDSQGRYVMTNERAARAIGRPREAIIGRGDAELFDAATAKLYRDQDARIVQSGQPMSIHRTAMIEGEARRIVVTKQRWTGPDGLPGGIVGITRDVTDQHLMQIEREQVSKRLMQAQEAERLRIARELHDQVGQDLTGLSLGLKNLEGDVAAPGVQAQLRWLRDLTDKVSRDLHRTALELRPTSLEDFGLRQAMASHVCEWSGRFGLRVDVELGALDGLTLDADAQIAIYRCVQESLTNILKHAKASSISVAAQRTAHELRLIVEDDGQGFDTDVAQAKAASGGMGLIGMRERLGHVGGRLLVESTMGSGSTIFISIPVAEGLA